MDVGRGGRERSTAQIAEALALGGHEVTILCQSGSWDAPGVRVEALGRRGWLGTARLKSFIQDVQRRIANKAFDIVHAMLPLPGADVYQLRSGTIPAQRQASLRRRSPLVRPFTALAMPFNRGRVQRAKLERQVVQKGRTVCLAVSQMVAREIQEHYGVTDRVRVIYNAVEVPAVSDEQRADWRQRIRFRLGVQPGDPVFLVVAHNFALKGVLESLVAFERWYHGHGDVRGKLVIVGGKDVEGYHRIAGMREIGSQVHFEPPTGDIFPWYSAADACLLLSWYDPCSRVVLEAVRWGLPAITTAFNGASEILSGGAGLVVPRPDDYPAVVAALDAMADAKRRAAASAACHAAAGELGIQRHVEQLLAVYDEIARRK